MPHHAAGFRRRRAASARAGVSICLFALAASGDRISRAAAVGTDVSAPAALAECDRLRRLVRHDTNYMDAVIAGDASATVVVAAAAKAGANANASKDTADATATAARIAALGGKVLNHDAAVGYLRATIPTQAIRGLACDASVEAIEVDGEFGTGDLTMPEGAFGRTFELGHPWAPPQGRYEVLEEARMPLQEQAPITFPLGEMGIDRFLRDHPTYDGRGVTVAVIEWAPDLLADRVWDAPPGAGGGPKVLRPAFEWPDRATSNQYVIRLKPEIVSGARVRLDSSYAVSAELDGQRVLTGVIDERGFSQYENDLNRDGNPNGSSPYTGILRDPATHRVWVDVGQDRSFGNDTPFTCGAEPTLTLGTDDPRTAIRESTGVLVLCDASRDSDVLFVPTAVRHATSISTGALATAFRLGGHGAAPGARLLPVLRFSAGTSGFIESLLVALRDPRSDIVTAQIIAPRRLQDGRSVAGLVLDRAVRHYRKPVFSSAGNSPPGLGTVTEGATATEIISVGAFTSSATLAALTGTDVAPGDPSFWAGAHGPRVDGHLKPDLVATAAAYTPTAAIFWPRRFKSGLVEGSPGETVSWGTSLASPVAAGTAALLVSAARQEGFEPTYADIRAALMFSAKRLPAYGVDQQGSGLIDVPAAWGALRQRVRQLRLRVQAPVATALARQGDVGVRGPGLFEREGWTTKDIGKSASRTVTLTREDGPDTATRFDLQLSGDTRAFSLPSSIVLPLDRPIDVPVRITPRQAGVHSALVRLVDATGAFRAQFPLTVVIAHDLPAAGASDPLTLRGEIPTPLARSHFINVPPGLESVTWTMTVTAGQIRPQLVNPASMAFMAGAQFQEGVWQYTLTRPEAGVWELILDNARGSHTWHPPGTRALPTASYVVDVRADANGGGTHNASTRTVNPVNPANPANPAPPMTFAGTLDSRTFTVMQDFHVAQAEATVILNSTAAAVAGDACDASHRLLLQYCGTGRCTHAIGSPITNTGTTLTARGAKAGSWRAVVWRTSPSACRQELTMTLQVIDKVSPPRETAAASRRR